MLAGAAFAADIGGTAKLSFDAFSFDTASKAWTVIGAPADGSEVEVTATTKDEKAGASVTISTCTTVAVNGAIWFKPVEQVKVSVYKGKFGVDVTLKPVSFGGTLTGPVASSAYGTPEWYAYVAYADADSNLTLKGEISGQKTEDKLKFVGTVTTKYIPSTVLTVVDTVTSKTDKLYVKAVETIDDLKFTEEVTTVGTYAGGATLAGKLSFETKVEDYTIYATAAHADFIKFTESATTVTAGVKSKFGVMSWDAGLKVVGTPANGTCAISVPVVLTVAF